MTLQWSIINNNETGEIYTILRYVKFKLTSQGNEKKLN